MKTLHTTYTNFAKRLVMSLIVLMTVGVTNLWADIYTATLTFDDLSKRTEYNQSQQVWEENEIVFTNKSTNETTIDQGHNYNPIRCFAKTSITIECPGKITKIVASASAEEYAENLDTSVGQEASKAGNDVTITPSSLKNTYIIDKLSAQVRLNSITVTYDLEPIPVGDLTATLVTKLSDLKYGDKIVIAATYNKETWALGLQADNNRYAKQVLREDNTIIFSGDIVQIITFEEGINADTYAFNVGNGYLYAASSGSNHLKTQQSNNNNGSWKIEINNTTGIATIIATGSNTRNWLRYNDQNDIFSCYASGQQDVSIYKMVTCENKVAISKGQEINATISSITPPEIQTCSDNAAERQVTITATPNAGYELNENSVIYNTISGTSVATKVSVTSNTYTFQFSKDDNGEGTFSVSANPIEYTITFDKQDGKGGTDKATVTFDNHDYSPNTIEIPTLSGYNFAGYYTQTNGAGLQIVNANGQWQSDKTGYIDTDGNWIKADNITLYAYWTARRLTNFRTSCSYTATWQANGGQWSDGTTEDIEEYNVGETITPPTDPTRDGYTFAGWDPEVPATMPAEDQTFTAIWENCRWVEIGADITKIISGSEVVITTEYEGQLYALPNNGGNSAPKATSINAIDILAGNADITCIWDVTKDANNNLIFHSASNSEEVLFSNKGEGDVVKVGKPDGTNNATNNSTFIIYSNFLVNKSTLCYLGIGRTDDQSVWKTYEKTTGNIASQTLRIFQRICLDDTQHWVTWDANGGQFADGSTTQTTSLAVGATITHPANPTREGYTFTGWSPTTSTVGDEDITFVAQWQINSYTVTWNANGGKFDNEISIEQSYTYGATITAPADPTRIGYTFAVWDPAPAATMPASDLTYDAQWNCAEPTDIEINGAYIVFPGETIQLTVTGNNIADDATYTWKKGDQIVAGQTTATLTIPNCVVGDAANYKCVVSNGTCSAENNFTVKMYRLRGLTDDSWSTDYVFSKAEGNTATYEITLNGESNYRFKVFDGTDYYGNNEGSDNTNPTMTHDNCTDWVMQQNKGYDVTLSTTITGVYTFILNYTDESNPTISVIYPKKKTIYLNPNIWDVSNIAEYYTVYSWSPVGSEFIPMEYADCNGKVYMAEIDAAHTQVIFIRYNRHVNNFNDNWNQTVDIPLDANNSQYRIDEWENNDKKSYGAWESYTPYYSISYNMNGHGQSIGDICIKKDDIWIAPDDPSAVGYTFLGWRRPAETGDNTLYKKGVAGFPVASDEELTAQWTFAMEYNITNTETIFITSAKGQTVKAATQIMLQVNNMPDGTTIGLSAANIKFYFGNEEIKQLTNKYVSETFPLTIAYAPDVANTTEQPAITLSVMGNEKTFEGLISARSLPETFAVVAKVGNMWYALPSQGLNATDDLMGYPVEVDNQDDPTVVTKAPANADWSLRQVYAGQNANATKDRFKQFGANIMFENNASPAKMLSASVSDNYLLTNAEYDNYKQSDNQGLYEWTPTTTDLETYQLTNAERAGRKLSIDILTRFGIYKGEIENMRFLPIKERYTPASLQVVEWKENSIVIMYTGDPAQMATLAIDGTTAIGSAILNKVNKDVAIYELPASGLMNYATKRLLITIGNGQKWLTVPYIINNSTTDADVLNSTRTTKAVAAVTDVVVLNGATFTAAGTKSNKYTFRTIHVYGGGKLVVPASATEGLGIYSLILRLGTVENGTYTNSYPQLVMNGKYSNTSGIYLDYITTYERYYALSVPYPVKTKDIKYPADIYGDNLKSGNKASFALQYYDGAARATGATGWKDFDESSVEPILTPYQGYTFWGAPRKVSVNGGDAQRPKFGIHRIQLTGVGADDLLKSENEDKTINITAYPANRPNDMGWNFLGNPYLAQYGGLSASNEYVQVGLLEHEMVDGKWTGGWKHTGNLRYVTTTTDGQNYTAVEVDKATFSPFNTFFIQAATKGALSFVSASRAQSLPARHYAAQQETAKEITTGIILTGNDQTDRTGLLIADNFTEEYDFNADLSKFENSGINLYTIGKDGKLAFMAINQALAEQPIPVGYSAPAEGLYTIAFDEDRYNATDISALYLIDYDFNEKTNLLHADYSFVTAAGTNNQRFALQVAFAPENATNVEWVGDATIQVGVEGHELILNNLPTDAAVHVFDALGRLMYHTLHAPTEMQLTLPTGYYLVRIADKQHAAVINTVIP